MTYSATYISCYSWPVILHSVGSGIWCRTSIVCINTQLNLQCSIGHTTVPVGALDLWHKVPTSYFSSHCRMWLSLLAYTTSLSLLVVGWVSIDPDFFTSPMVYVSWWSGIGLVRWLRSIKLTYVGPGLYWDGWLCPGLIPGAWHLSRYVTSHPGLLSLALSLWAGTMSTSPGMVVCEWQVKLWSSCYSCTMSELYHFCPVRQFMLTVWL